MGSQFLFRASSGTFSASSATPSAIVSNGFLLWSYYSILVLMAGLPKNAITATIEGAFGFLEPGNHYNTSDFIVCLIPLALLASFQYPYCDDAHPQRFSRACVGIAPQGYSLLVAAIIAVLSFPRVRRVEICITPD